MASPTVASLQVNGLASVPRPDSAASINSPTKRKRDDSVDESAPQETNQQQKKHLINANHAPRNQKILVRDCFEALRRYALHFSFYPSNPPPALFFSFFSSFFLPSISSFSCSTILLFPISLPVPMYIVIVILMDYQSVCQI